MISNLFQLQSRLDKNFKATVYALEALADLNTVKSVDPNLSPFSWAMGKEETFWQFLQCPEMEFRQCRFAIAMQGIETLQPPAASSAKHNIFLDQLDLA